MSSRTERARNLRQNQTEAEKRLWYFLRNRGIEGFKFRRQVPRGPYIVDFFCAETGLVVELDGGQHAERTIEDAHRTAYLESKGYRVLRFWNNEVLQNTEGVLEAIRNALTNSASF